MVAVPEIPPVTTPPEVTVATVVALLFQVPPEMLSVNVAVPPGQMDERPEMEPTTGEGSMVTFTVPVILLAQPVMVSVATTL
jgi:hypothetical protein